MLVALKLMFLSRNENRMLSGNPLNHSTLKGYVSRVDTTIDRCHNMRGHTDGMTELWPKPPTEMIIVKLSYINLS